MSVEIATATPARAGSHPGGVREIATLAYPVVLTQLSSTTMFLVDSAMVGRLGASELAAVGFAGVWLWTALCVFMGTTQGVQTFASQAHGAGRPRECGAWAWQGLYAVAPFTVLGIGGFLLLLEPLLGLLGPSQQIQELATSYIHHRAVGAPALVAGMALASFFRGVGDTRTPLRAMITANLVNATLAYGLIFGNLGLPRLGVAGAGAATGLAEWVYLGVLVMAFRRPAVVAAHATRPVAPDLEAIRRFLRTSAPIGGQWVLDMSSFALFSTLVARMGDASMAASHALLNLLSLSFMQAIGISIAASTLVGRYKGASDLDSAARSYRSAMKLALLVATGVAALFLAAPNTLLRIFSDDPAVVSLGRQVMALGAAFQFFDAVGIVAGGSLRGAGDTRWPLFVQTSLAWCLRLPLAWTFGIAAGLGLLGAWLAESVYIVVLGAAFMLRFRSGAWRKVVI